MSASDPAQTNPADRAALTLELARVDARLDLCRELIAGHRDELEKLRGARDDLRENSDAELHTIPPHMVWNRQPHFLKARERFGHVQGIPDIRCAFLQSCLRSLDRIEGDIAECGVRNGRSTLFMLSALEVERRMYLFDSFEGLSDPQPEKDGIETAFDASGDKRMFQNENLGDLHDRLAPFGDRVQILQGWIPDRFAEVADRRFCFVHLDVDLFQPTMDGLAFFYDRLEPGGIIVCDDYGTSHYPGARRAMDEFFAERPETPVELAQGQGFVVKDAR